MSRSARLLDLIQLLRRHRRPVTATVLATELAVSERTIYRDIVTLAGQGVPVEGEAGIGYVLRPGYLLPPLMFGEDELDALMLGLRWVASRDDQPLARAAGDVLAKIAAVLPQSARETIFDTGLLAGARSAAPLAEITLLRQAIRVEQKLLLTYTDAKDAHTQRVVWPIAVAFFDQARVLVAWCELRQGFRHFRTDRIAQAELQPGRYTPRRRVLLARWQAEEGVAAQL